MWNWEIFNPICWKYFISLHYSWFCSEVYWSLKSPSKFFLYILIWISQPSPHNLTFFWYIECVQFSSITIIFNVLRHTPNLPDWQLLPVNPTSHRHWYVSCPKSEDTQCLNMDSFVKMKQEKYMFTREVNRENMIDHCSYAHNLGSSEIGPAPSWIASGRVSHRYRRGHGLKTHSSLNFFFQALITA